MAHDNWQTNKPKSPLSISPSATSEQAIERAVSSVNAAAAAFPTWSQVSPEKRAELLLSAADNFHRQRHALKIIAAQEVGSKENWLDINIDTAIKLLRYAASLTSQISGETLPTDSLGKVSMSIRQPVGVCLGMASWNAPILLAIRAIAVPLACANTVILKASELCPQTHQLIGEIFTQSGFDQHVVQVVTNQPDEASAVVDALIAHPAIRRINFTGSTRVGRLIAQRCAHYLKPCLLELSGKSPFIVLDDADIEAAVDAAIYGSFMNQGQLCMSTEKIVLQESIAAQFIECLVAKARLITSNLTADTQAKLGPLINIESGIRIQSMIDDATAKGAQILCGGQVNGVYLDATIIDKVIPSMRIYFEECFAPVAQIIRCKNDDEAITIANDSDFGLSAAVFSKDINRALSIAKRIESGICHINSTTIADEAQAPFGGMKSSGYGRFGSKAAIEEFTELRWITISESGSPTPPF